MFVLTGIKGSFCVLVIRPEFYLDARQDRRHPSFTFIEIVRDGFVLGRETVHNNEAPERIMALARLTLKGKPSDYIKPSIPHRKARPPARRS